MSSQREDSLQRQLKAIAAMLARIAGLRVSGATEEARSELEQAYGLLLGPEDAVVRRIDPSTAVTMLGTSDRALAFAALLEEEASQEHDEARSRWLRGRAAEVGRAVLDRDPGNEGAQAFLKNFAPDAPNNQSAP